MNNFGRYKMLIAVERQWQRNGFGLNLGIEGSDGTLRVAQAVTFQECQRDAASFDAPAIFLSSEDAQRLADELWNVGIRPSSGVGSVGQLGATQKHLEEMSAIAIGLLRRDGVDL